MAPPVGGVLARALAIVPVLVAAAVTGSAVASPLGQPYDYPYPYSPGAAASTQGTISYTSPGGTTMPINVPAADIRNGQLVGMTLSGNFQHIITYSVAGIQPGTDPLVARTNEITQVTYNGHSGTQLVWFVTARCSFEPCVSAQGGTNIALGGGPSASLSLAGVLPTYTRGNADAYAAQIAPYLSAGSGTFSITSTLETFRGATASFSDTSPFNGSTSRFFSPWSTIDAVSDKLGVPVVSHGLIDFTAGTNFGFTAKEASILSQYDNFNWLVSLTSYCADIKLQGCDATHNDNALAPSQIGRNIPQYDGQAGGNQNNNERNPAGADNFDLYLDQVLSANAARAEFFVGDPRNANGLRFFDQPDLMKAGRVLVFHNDLVGWDESTQSWTVLSDIDPTLGFNWRWIQTGDSGTPQCDPQQGLTLNCGYAVSGGLIDPTENLGIAELLNYGAPDPNNFFAGIDPSLFDGTSGGGTGGDGGNASIPEPAHFGLLLLALGGLALPFRSRATGARG